jgi:hypothetical protein
LEPLLGSNNAINPGGVIPIIEMQIPGYKQPQRGYTNVDD